MAPQAQRSGEGRRPRLLAVRLDATGAVLLTGPAIRAMAATGSTDLLVAPAGLEAARLLPGVEDILVFDASSTGPRPPPVACCGSDGTDSTDGTDDLMARLRLRRYDTAVVFTSFHRRGLPAALLRLAGVRRVIATNEDPPGAPVDAAGAHPENHEVQVALALVAEAGCRLPVGGNAALQVRRPLPGIGGLVPAAPGFVVVHPWASAPARSLPARTTREICERLLADGHRVVLTGTAADREAVPTALVDGVIDLVGRLDLALLAAVLDLAGCVIAVNTGAAHVAAAVGTPVVSLFSPVVSAARWRPYGVPTMILGHRDAPCAGSGARDCPVAGHPCLADVDPDEVVAAARALCRG